MDLDSDNLYLRSLTSENNAGLLSQNLNNSSTLTGGIGGGINSTANTTLATGGRGERSFTNFSRDYRLSDDKYNSLINSLDDKYLNSSSAFDTTSKYHQHPSYTSSSSSFLNKTLGPTIATTSAPTITTTTTATSTSSSLYRPSILTGATNSLARNNNDHHPANSYLSKPRPLNSTTATRTNPQPSLYSSNIDSAAIDKLFPSSSLSNHANTTTTTTSRYNQDSYNSSLLLANRATGATTRDYLSRDPLLSTAYTNASSTTATRSGQEPLSYLHHHHHNNNLDDALLGSRTATTTTTTTTTTTSTSTTSAAINSTTTTLTGGANYHHQQGQTNTLQQLFEDLRQIEDSVTSIEIPARGKCRMFMAKYGYDPFKQSPNDNPDAELAFNAGDYIMVFDDIDEDGYFIGELMDGRRGYVPSNWLDRLIGDDLLEFQATTLYKQAMGTTSGQVTAGGGGASQADELDSQSYPPEFYDALITDTMNHSNFQHLLAPEDYHRMNDYVDLDDVDEVDDECLSDYERAEAEQMRRAVPPPQRLVVEKLLNKSILISWLHPQSVRGTIVSYQVFVDGVAKQTIPSGDRTKALLDGVDSSIPHRVSVRAIDLHGRHSNDAGCTIVIGQNIPFAPSCVKASHITSDSALISWLPCNSNFHHVVAVNSVEVQTVRPGVYKHLINGLSANTLYRVWVRAKPGKILSVDEKNPKKLESLTTYVDFKTMPKSLPDPPVNVQVEAGPQRRTLLVTWLPLTLNDFGSSNGCAVTGYAVFAGHKKLADIDSPTGDHALLDLADLESLHKKSVTVRTKSGENLSQDSMPCQIPDEYLKQAASRGIDLAAMTNQHHHQQIVMRNQQQQQQQSGSNRLSDPNIAHHHSQAGTHSPLRHHRIPGQQQLQQHHHHHQQQQRPTIGSSRGYLGGNRSSRQIARSLQNLESDLDSRRSSIPAIEITRETSGSDIINPTESYSEEEFENSMRFKGGMHHHHRGKTAGRPGSRYRARQSHSVDGSAIGVAPGAGHHQGQHQQQMAAAAAAAAAHRSYQSQANLSIAAANRLRGTPGDIKYFVALFDYDPSTMSPNPNAAADELAFKEGSIIKVYGSLGEDGFYKGEIDNQMGYVPCNVITEITDPNLLNSLYEKSNQQQQNLAPNQIHQRQMMQQANVANLQQQQQTQNQLIDPLQQQQQQHQQQQQPNQQQPQQQQQQQPQQGGVKRMIALYDYDPQENSPNADTESEIPFKIDDVIYVYGKMDTDGFYMGEVERTKQRGLVPSNFLREDPLALNRQPAPQAAGLIGAGALGPANPTSQQAQMMMNQQNANQMLGNISVPSNQQQQPMDMTRMPMQQQPMSNQNQLRGGNIRGPVPIQQQQQQQQQHQQTMQPMMANVDSQQPNNINRPTTLSLNNQLQNTQQPQQQLHNQHMNVGAMGGGPMGQQQQPAGNINMQQQQPNRMMPMQQQQQIQNNNQLQMAMNNQQAVANQQPKSFVMANANMQPTNSMGQQVNQQQQMNPQQQQQQGGVLSNLLSSGKQIIGAATTPRIPNQPGGVGGQFAGPMMGQPVQQGNNANMMMQQQHPDGNFQAPLRAAANNMNMIRAPNAAMSAFNSQPMGVGGNVVGVDPSLQHQQQPIGHNSFGPLAPGNPLMMGQQQQQQQHHHQQQQLQHHQQQLQQQHHQQQNQQYNQLGGFNRPGTVPPQGGMNQMGGEEQGGNILNTVKNMFKL